MLPRLAAVVCLAAAALLIAPAAVPAAASPPKQLYVSLGDSYATGWQPSRSGPGRNTRNAELVARRLPRRR